MEIKGSVAVITGGGNGIGEAIAKYFVTHGAKVVIVDMAQKHIDRVLGEIKAMGGEAIGRHVDQKKFLPLLILIFLKTSASGVQYYLILTWLLSGETKMYWAVISPVLITVPPIAPRISYWPAAK